jgi:type II secretory pathway pseudopilin PulG
MSSHAPSPYRAAPTHPSCARVGHPERGDEGFMLIAAIIMIFLVLLTLSIAAPRIAREVQRDREQESERRGEQYVRAIRIFYLKFKRYPTSIEQLEKTNNQRFLRQRYVDPLTGKDDWRIIHQGENQTTVKGFFGDDLPGLPGGLGAAAGMASSTSSSSAFGNSTIGTPIGGGLGAQAGAGAAGATGAAGVSGTGTGAGTAGSTSSSGGIASQDATTFTGSGGGPIIGVGSNKRGEAMLVVNEQTTYETWEFLYDPRIEQLYAKANFLGGIASGTGTSGGFGSPINTTLPAAPAGFGSGSGTTTPTAPTPPTVGAPIPQ